METMPRKGALGDPNALEGLAQAWEKSRRIRDNTLRVNSLLVWPKKSLTGVISFHTASYNFSVLARLFKLYLPSIEKLKTININAARKEVLGLHVEPRQSRSLG